MVDRARPQTRVGATRTEVAAWEALKKPALVERRTEKPADSPESGLSEAESEEVWDHEAQEWITRAEKATKKAEARRRAKEAARRHRERQEKEDARREPPRQGWE